MPEEKTNRLTPARLEAFSDGVIAVIITIMVLELQRPRLEISNLAGLRLIFPSPRLSPQLHPDRHLLGQPPLPLDDLDKVTHGILWSNLALLFASRSSPWPRWVGVRGISSSSIALYGAVCAFPALPWMVLSTLIQRRSKTPPASGMVKQAASVFLYFGSIAVAFFSPWIAIAMIALVALLWILPPRKIVELSRGSTHPPL